MNTVTYEIGNVDYEVSYNLPPTNTDDISANKTIKEILKDLIADKILYQ